MLWLGVSGVLFFHCCIVFYCVTMSQFISILSLLSIWIVSKCFAMTDKRWDMSLSSRSTCQRISLEVEMLSHRVDLSSSLLDIASWFFKIAVALLCQGAGLVLVGCCALLGAMQGSPWHTACECLWVVGWEAWVWFGTWACVCVKAWVFTILGVHSAGCGLSLLVGDPGSVRWEWPGPDEAVFSRLAWLPAFG